MSVQRFSFPPVDKNINTKNQVTVKKNKKHGAKQQCVEIKHNLSGINQSQSLIDPISVFQCQSTTSVCDSIKSGLKPPFAHMC